MRLNVLIFLLFAMLMVVESIHPYGLAKKKAVGVGIGVGAKKLHLVQKAALAKLLGAKKAKLIGKKAIIGKKYKVKKVGLGIGAAKLKKKALIKKPLIFYG